MTGCPFGFSGGDGGAEHDYTAEGHDALPRHAPAQAAKCPFSGGAATAAADGGNDRFDYNKDPISWFYQNQIKSEEQFQAKRSELREAAKERLENIFEAKGKHLIIDSDDDFSINTSELSAWDSGVYSIRTLASCANSWAEAADFKAPALVTMRLLLLATLAAALFSGWRAVQGMLSVNQYWGIITVGWVPSASLAAAAMVATAAAALWYLTDTKSKAGLLGGQVAMQVLSTACSVLAVVCWAYPIRVDPHLNGSLCRASGPQPSEVTSRLCHYLPLVQEQVDLIIGTLCTTSAALALLCLGVASAGTWHFWELAYVEKKAAKHRRRRKQRKNAIPWDKIKIEDIGPVSYCGSGGPQAARPCANAAAAASAAGVAAATTAGRGGGGGAAAKKQL